MYATNSGNSNVLSHEMGLRSYELTNHLGNVLSVISDKVIPHPSGGSVAYYKADILQAMDYSPFGVTLKGRNLEKTGLSDKFRFGFQGYEGDPEMKGNGNSYTTEFRQYDPRLGRWLSLDPKLVKYPDMSPYNSFGNNPIINIDKRGDTIARFTWDGDFIGFLDDGKTEWSGRRENAIANKDKNGNVVSYSHDDFKFADPINDPKSLKNGTITHLVFVYETDIKDMLENAGAFNPENQNNSNTVWFLRREGPGGGSFDFSTQHIPYHKWKQDVEFDNVPIGNQTDALFYVKSQKTAHNHFNFGNFLFGAGGQALGVDLGLLLYGANENSLKGDSNGYGGQPDSKDDQMSIGYGYTYAEKKKFDQIHIDPKGSSGGNNNQKKSDETR